MTYIPHKKESVAVGGKFKKFNELDTELYLLAHIIKKPMFYYISLEQGVDINCFSHQFTIAMFNIVARIITGGSLTFNLDVINRKYMLLFATEEEKQTLIDYDDYLILIEKMEIGNSIEIICKRLVDLRKVKNIINNLKKVQEQLIELDTINLVIEDLENDINSIMLKNQEVQNVKGEETEVYNQNFADELLDTDKKSVKLGYKIGFPTLDFHTMGLQNGQVTTIVAPTSVGKSAFMINCAINIVKQNDSVDVLYLDTEMSQEDFFNRTYSILTGIKAKNIATRTVRADEREKIVQARDFLNTTGMRIIYKSLDNYSPNLVKNVILNYKASNPNRKFIVILDYLKSYGSASYKESNRKGYEILGEYINAFHTMAQNFQFPMILGVQSNKSKEAIRQQIRNGQEPNSDDLEGGKAVPRYSDNCFFLIDRTVTKDEIAEVGRMDLLEIYCIKGRHCGEYMQNLKTKEYSKCYNVVFNKANQQITEE